MTLRFDPQRHAETIAALRRVIAGIQDQLDGLDREVTALRGQWSGAAQAAYERTHREWADSIGRLHSALADATGAAQHAGDRLTQTEADVTALWS
ncbi:WXG100 family type VII secretion target [uncultured Microbacterium sp.]|uniref:WXG100 family type VII secretion target n=1 Tax=uncultured Microbacterium sp. TaxID=191216 RepID=UPI0025DBE430|nr:WXG100 family type VII secretion target [uncultured Microbacterium sp.]